MYTAFSKYALPHKCRKKVLGSLRAVANLSGISNIKVDFLSAAAALVIVIDVHHDVG